jgi:hypothetical protein
MGESVTGRRSGGALPSQRSEILGVLTIGHKIAVFQRNSAIVRIPITANFYVQRNVVNGG